MIASAFKPGDNIVLRLVDNDTVYVGKFVRTQEGYFELSDAAFVSYEKFLPFLNEAELTAIYPVGEVCVSHCSIKEVFKWKHHLPSTMIKSLKKVSKKKTT